MSILSFSGPANSYLELRGLFLGNTVIKVIGYMGALCHAFPSYSCSLSELSSAWRTLPRIWSSAKMRGTEFVSALPAWQPAEPEHPNTAAFAPCSLCSEREQLSWGCSCSFLGLCGTRVLQLQPCQHHAESSALLPSLLPEQVHSINDGISKSLILPLAQFKASCTHGLACLILGLPFKFKLLWLIPLIYSFQCESQQQQRVQEGLWVLLSWTLLPPEITGTSSIFLIYFLDNHLLVEWAAPRGTDSWAPTQHVRWWKLSEEMSSTQQKGLQTVLRLGKSSLSSSGPQHLCSISK